MADKGTKNQGVKVYVGTKAADASSDTFVQVKRCKVVGEYGAEAQVIDATALEDSVKHKLKGIPDSGDIELGGNRVFTDPGQNALKAASSDNDDDPYNLRIEVPGAGASGADLRYDFKALVTKFKDSVGNVDDLIGFDAMVAVTGAITETVVTP
ncbi:MAG: hypothetical protein AAFR04_13920 [Pseudomonadota bacterium]